VVEILDQSSDKIFRRTIVGDSEIRERSLPLTKIEQTVLVSVDGEASFLQLSQQFEAHESAAFEMAMVSLLQKGLIEPMEVPALHSHTDLLKAEIAGFEAEDFFSSSGDPMHSGSGLVVDTRNNTMRSVNAKKPEADDLAEVDLFIPLGEEDTGGRKKKRMQKLVEVYPDPSKQKRRKRRKRVEPPPQNKWILRVYLGLIALGLIAVLGALLLA
jgi:hypothetical protein